MVYLKKNQTLFDSELLPGEYRQIPSDHCVWRCPKCKQLTTVGRHIHYVRYDGFITPGLKCPTLNCDFNAHVTLQDWIPRSEGSA